MTNNIEQSKLSSPKWMSLIRCTKNLLSCTCWPFKKYLLWRNVLSILLSFSLFHVWIGWFVLLLLSCKSLFVFNIFWMLNPYWMYDLQKISVLLWVFFSAFKKHLLSCVRSCCDFCRITGDLSLWSTDHIVAPHELGCPESRGIFVPPPDIKPMSSALKGRYLTTGPPVWSFYSWPGNRGPTECGSTHEATSGMSSWDRPHPELRPEGREPLQTKQGDRKSVV